MPFGGVEGGMWSPQDVGFEYNVLGCCLAPAFEYVMNVMNNKHLWVVFFSDIGYHLDKIGITGVGRMYVFALNRTQEILEINLCHLVSRNCRIRKNMRAILVS